MIAFTVVVFCIAPLVSHGLISPAPRNDLQIDKGLRTTQTVRRTRQLHWIVGVPRQQQHDLPDQTASSLPAGISTELGDEGPRLSPSASRGKDDLSVTAAEDPATGDQKASGFRARNLMRSLLFLTSGALFRILLKVFNKVECFNQETLIRAIFNRGDVGLLTVSNHASVYDDPGLWAAAIPFWRLSYDQLRWSMCTDDIYNANPQLRTLLKLGKAMPIDRKRGMEQVLFKDFFDKLEQGKWGHIFAEGAIRQPWRFGKEEPILGDFKVGIGRLLLRSKKLPMVLPMYHIGMHQVAPEQPVRKRTRGKLAKPLPNIGRKILVYVGEPIDVKAIVEECKAEIGDVSDLPWVLPSTQEEIACHKKIASYVRDRVLELEPRARRDYYGTDSCSPYGPIESQTSPTTI